MSENTTSQEYKDVNIKGCKYLECDDGVRVYMCDCSKHSGVLWGCAEIDPDTGDFVSGSLIDLPYEMFTNIALMGTEMLANQSEIILHANQGVWRNV